jgi:transcriptional repressor NrdR
MHCPFCDHADTQVLDTRVSDEGEVVRRRRRCGHCDKRFTTYERIELNLPSIIKRNGARADYDRRKVRASMALSLRKRPVSADVVDAAIGRIEERLTNLAVKEVPSERIGELVIRELRKMDKVAYIRYASVYKSFEDVDEFADAIAEVATKGAVTKGVAVRAAKKK